MSYSSLLARVADLFASPGIPLANRNLIVDGRFDVWNASSGTVSNTASGYGPAAMWTNYAGAGGAATFSQSTMVGVDSVLYGAESSPLWCFVHQQTTASTGTVAGYTTPNINQRIESAATFSGRSATFSIKLWTTSGSITIPSVLCRQNFGGGGTPSTGVFLDKTVNWIVTTIPKRFSVRLDFPSVNGKTFGTNGNDFIAIGLWLPPGVTFTLVGCEAQLEKSSPNSSSDINGNGGAPTAFEYRGVQAELARVARYYQTFYTSAGAGFAEFACTATTGGYGYSTLPGGYMRAMPAISSVPLATTMGGSVSLTPGPNYIQYGVTGLNVTSGWSGLIVGGSSAGNIVMDARL